MKLRRHIPVSLLALLVFACPLLSQPPQILWQRVVSQLPGENYPASIVQAPDGNLVFGRTYHIGENGVAGEVIKATTEGDLLWRSGVEIYDGIKSYTNDVCVDASGNAWMTGIYWVPLSAKFPLLARFSSAGDRQWQRVATHLHERPVRITPLSDGGAAVVAKDGILARVSEQGQLLWFVDLDTANTDVYMNDVIVYEGGLLFAGSWEETGQSRDLLLVHTDMDGNILWQASNPAAGPLMQGVLALDDGAFVALSYSEDYQLTLNWFETNGVLISQVTFDLYRKNDWDPSDSFSLALDRMPDGGFLIGGTSEQHQAKLIRTNSDGVVLWEMVNDGDTAHTAITDVILLDDGRIQCIGMKRYYVWTTWLLQLAVEGTVVDAAPVELPPLELTGE